MQETAGYLLGGRLQYLQPAAGYRTGIEPVLLAASIPAGAGQHVLEGGTGAGSGLMCLAARVPGISGVGVEVDSAMAELARRNIKLNGFSGLAILTSSILQAPAGEFDHAFANPPWHDPASTPSPNARRQLAKQATSPGLEGWIAALRRTLRSGGSLTLILPAVQVPRAISAMNFFSLGGIDQTPLLPRADRAPKLVILTGWLGDSRPDRVNAPVVLHAENGAYMPEVEAVLRGGSPLPINLAA